jgi:hypothetical protein
MCDPIVVETTDVVILFVLIFGLLMKYRRIYDILEVDWGGGFGIIVWGEQKPRVDIDLFPC